MKRGAIILCGGISSRMGSPKALLPWGSETMLQRVVRLVGEAVPQESIVVVAAAGQELPPLPEAVRVTRDRTPHRGPLEGIACGLTMLGDQVDTVYVTGCDVPLLVPAFIERMFSLLGEHEIAVPVDVRFRHPLAGVYRPTVLPHVEALLAADRLRPAYLLDECDTLEVPVAELRVADPELASLRNVNTRADYETELASTGRRADS
jgi:molybdopterin-guanine dinucleotide biosynthesis protein A